MENGIYPEGPPPCGKEILPGEGVNCNPEDQQTHLEYTGPVGLGTKAYYAITSQLEKLGFVRVKINEWMFVSPVNKPYYDLTTSQRDQLALQIKQHLASIATAISELELAKHDLRKYKEFVDIFEKLEKGKKLIQEGKKEEGKKLLLEANQTLRAIFIDQVDIHTGEGISLRSIAVRWPTIISDFMKLDDGDVDPSSIAKKLKVSEAEGVVLATKNKLFLEWKNNLFKPAVLERYKNLLKLVEARKNSIKEYEEMAKPIIRRYKMLNDALSNPSLAAGIKRSFFRPDTQAISIDFMEIWAWKPIAPLEKYKVSREVLDKISLKEAGFTKEEIEYLRKNNINNVSALPVVPIVDNVLRTIAKNLEKKYGVIITPKDVVEVIEELGKYYIASKSGIEGGASWFFSPYFVFFDIPLTRVVIKFPDGGQAEVLEIKNFVARAKTQNVILGHLLELKVRDKVFERDVHSLLGEYVFKEDEKKWLALETFLKSEYPEVYGRNSEEVLSIKPPQTRQTTLDKISSILKKIGWEISFSRGTGPYEVAFKDRLTKFYFTETGKEFGSFKGFINSIFGVP